MSNNVLPYIYNFVLFDFHVSAAEMSKSLLCLFYSYLKDLGITWVIKWQESHYFECTYLHSWTFLYFASQPQY